ncbi:MAG: cytoplasmic protein [Methanobacterium sp. BRmetb2]|nr:MAG: cytoplasmic protein [Methanobacterium sp. BRmetb2]
MRNFEKPRLIVSKCIEFEPCRYNGLIISSDFVKKLKDYVEFQPVCPEVELGLGIPRDPIRLIDLKGEVELFQPATGRCLTGDMENFARSYLFELNDFDGFILKNKSPSCGVKAVKVYPGLKDGRPRTDGVGAFASEVFDKHPYLAVEDEGRLRNLKIRENFLTKIYTLSDFRNVKKALNINSLIEFHSTHKFLLMAYKQILTPKMGQIVANHNQKPIKDVIKDYEELLLQTLIKPPESTSNINILMHSMGYFSKELSHEEKSFFLDSIEKYREGIMPLIVNLNILKSWMIRFNEEYLAKQTFFEPYPEKLMPITTLYKRGF